MERIASTSNLDIASWWAFRGLELLEVDASLTRARFIFVDPAARAEDLTQEYWRGDVSRFVSRRMRLRDVMSRAKSRRRACPTFAASSFEDRHP